MDPTNINSIISKEVQSTPEKQPEQDAELNEKDEFIGHLKIIIRNYKAKIKYYEQKLDKLETSNKLLKQAISEELEPKLKKQESEINSLKNDIDRNQLELIYLSNKNTELIIQNKTKDKESCDPHSLELTEANHKEEIEKLTLELNKYKQANADLKNELEAHDLNTKCLNELKIEMESIMSYWVTRFDVQNKETQTESETKNEANEEQEDEQNDKKQINRLSFDLKRKEIVIKHLLEQSKRAQEVISQLQLENEKFKKR